MEVYVDCSRCGAKDHPRLTRLPSYPEMQAGIASTTWIPPDGWAEYATSRGAFTVCRACKPEVEYAIAQAMNPPRSAPKDPT